MEKFAGLLSEEPEGRLVEAGLLSLYAGAPRSVDVRALNGERPDDM